MTHVGIINVKNPFLHFRTYILVRMYLLRYRKVKKDFYITNSFMTMCRDFLHGPCEKSQNLVIRCTWIQICSTSAKVYQCQSDLMIRNTI